VSRHDDQALLEAVRTHRERLRGAFLFGSLGSRRSSSTLIGRLIGSMIAATIAVAVCAGVSFAISVIPKHSTPATVTPSPVGTTPSPTGSNTTTGGTR